MIEKQSTYNHSIPSGFEIAREATPALKYCTALISEMVRVKIKVVKKARRADMIIESKILNQEEHHRKRTFRAEYLEFLEKFEVPYEERFLFEWLDE
ncbi:MAG: hypothetical protein ACE5G1_09000 [bacterium]